MLVLARNVLKRVRILYKCLRDFAGKIIFLIKGYRSKSSEPDENLDQISKLNDDLLHRILTLVPTNQVIQTSILSKRWKDVWATIPYVNFDETIFVPISETPDDVDVYNKVHKFMIFVETFLDLYKGSTIDTMRITCSSYIDTMRFYAWIQTAVLKYNIKGLDINISMEFSKCTLPNCLLTSTSLQSLAIQLSGSEICILDDEIVHLPKLSNLRLKFVSFVNNNIIHHLVSSCPTLVNLHVEDCNFNYEGLIHISGPKLESLVIIGLNWYGEYEENCTVEIDTPMLTCFTYNSLLPSNFLFAGSSLEKAKLDMRYRVPRDLAQGNNVFEAVSTAKELHLSPWTFDFLPSSCPSVDLVPVFSNLTRLYLHSPLNRKQIGGITRLLRRSPNIEFLQLDIIQVRLVSKEIKTFDEWFFEIDFSQLKLVKIYNMQASLSSTGGKQTHMEFIRCLLTYALVLERLIIKLGTVNPKARMLATQELMALPKTNENCVVAII